MKRCLSIIAALFILLNTSYGQMKLKAFAGINVSSLANIYSQDLLRDDQLRLESYSKSVINPSIGIQMQFDLSEKVNFNLESQFNFKGQKYGDDNYVERSLYVEFIPSIDVNIWNGFSFGLGYYIGVRPYTYFSDKNSISLADYYRNDWDYGGMVSMSYNVERLTFRMAYYHGLKTIYTDIFPIEDFNKWIKLDKQNRVYQFSVGYTLCTKKSNAKSKVGT